MKKQIKQRYKEIKFFHFFLFLSTNKISYFHIRYEWIINKK